jgi:RimJ/RimL family protein N-acetyltransferase
MSSDDQMTFDVTKVTFRPLTKADVPLLHRWINYDADIRRWFGRDAGPLSKLEAKYLPRINGTEPTRSYVIECLSRPIAYIQEYLIHDHPAWVELVGLEEKAAGVDLFIGEPEHRGHGRARVILQRFLQHVVFARDEVVSCVIGPNADNLRAIRSYEKTGFRHFKTVFDPTANEHVHLMRVSREQVVGD